MDIDISKGISGMTNEEKEAFIQCIDMECDFFPCSTTILKEEIVIYNAILAERRTKNG